MKNVNSAKYTCKFHNENKVGTMIFNLVSLTIDLVYLIYGLTKLKITVPTITINLICNL